MQLSQSLKPKKFSEVYGHKNIISNLLGCSKTNNFPNAILFKGTPGNGKSSLAGLVAMALNCKFKGLDGEPCGGCASCLAVLEERFDTTSGVKRLNGSASSKDDVIDFA